MAQWVNRLRNNIFVNPPPLPLSCEISGALHLAQPGLTVDRRLTKYTQISKFSKLPVGWNIRVFMENNSYEIFYCKNDTVNCMVIIMIYDALRVFCKVILLLRYSEA